MKTRRSNSNWALLCTVALPPICTGYLLSHFCVNAADVAPVCDVYVHMPLLSVNILWLLHVDITFYIISLVQDSTWLIDPYWTLAPPMLAGFWMSHPTAALWNARQMISCILMVVWATRLTHSYFRREGWCAGTREDWRYADMKQRFGRWWPLAQVVAVYAVQHCMLVGLTLPWMAISFSGFRWNNIDMCACLLCVLGLAVAAHADNALYRFVHESHGQSANILQKGLWAVSRHPNHLGEQMWWWGVALFGVAAGSPWTVVGTVFNSICMWQIMALVEQRMCDKPKRAKLYQDYQRKVPFCVPWCYWL